MNTSQPEWAPHSQNHQNEHLTTRMNTSQPESSEWAPQSQNEHLTHSQNRQNEYLTTRMVPHVLSRSPRCDGRSSNFVVFLAMDVSIFALCTVILFICLHASPQFFYIFGICLRNPCNDLMAISESIRYDVIPSQNDWGIMTTRSVHQWGYHSCDFPLPLIMYCLQPRLLLCFAFYANPSFKYAIKWVRKRLRKTETNEKRTQHSTATHINTTKATTKNRTTTKKTIYAKIVRKQGQPGIYKYISHCLTKFHPMGTKPRTNKTENLKH